MSGRRRFRGEKREKEGDCRPLDPSQQLRSDPAGRRYPSGDNGFILEEWSMTSGSLSTEDEENSDCFCAERKRIT